MPLYLPSTCIVFTSLFIHLPGLRFPSEPEGDEITGGGGGRELLGVKEGGEKPYPKEGLWHQRGVAAGVKEGLRPQEGIAFNGTEVADKTVRAQEDARVTVKEGLRPQEGIAFNGTKVADKTVRAQEDARVTATDVILKETEQKEREKAAVKHDDAQVPEYLWEEHMLRDFDWTTRHGEKRVWLPTELAAIPGHLTALRRWALAWWKRNLRREFEVFLGEDVAALAVQHRQTVEWDSAKAMYHWIPISGRSSYVSWYRGRWGLRPHDMEAGRDAICRAWKSTWWEWDDGSRPFYWRWPEWYRDVMRDGMRVHFPCETPRHTVPQRDTSDLQVKKQMIAKLDKVRRRRYVTPGHVVSLTSFFAVPKGDDDIRMVYDGTASGLNDSMWLPRFRMSTIETHLRFVEPETFMADVDVGECFLNFVLHKSICSLAGVDLSLYFPFAGKPAVLWECWSRALMGAKSLPYQACQGMCLADELIRGDPRCPRNIFRWSKVRLNLPGSQDYDPAKAWVSKDAPRKRRDSSQTPGPWAGAVVRTGMSVAVLASETKWKRAKDQVNEVLEMIRWSPDRLDRKRLEQIRGFVGYVTRTYPSAVPYLTGLHMTIDGWRQNRDSRGWRLKGGHKRKFSEHIDKSTGCLEEECGEEDFDLYLRSAESVSLYHPAPDSRTGPSHVRAVPRLQGSRIEFEYGQWTTEDSENSSNWRELKNLVTSIRTLSERQNICGSELFIFTDNTTAEQAYSKGSSKSEHLFELVLELRLMEMKLDVLIHVIHVSGKRMIHQGTDGLSRGDHSQGVMRGLPILKFVPLHQDAFSRSQGVRTWLENVLKGFGPTFLTPEGWFEHNHDFGNYVWSPAPAAADVVVDLLGKARHKRPESLHLVVVPRLMTGRWRRHLQRGTDFHFSMDSEPWDTDTLFEPLLIFIALPFRVHDPKLKEREKLLEKYGGTMRQAWMRNIMGRNPSILVEADEEIKQLITRATLDAFWSREQSTVKANLAGALHMERTNDRLGMPCTTPPMGPYPLRDVWGMQCALNILDRSMDAGLYEEKVQYETFRKMRSVATNITQAGVGALEDMVGAYERSRVWISKVPTHSFWFSTRFMVGLHKRHGEVVKQDWPLPIEVLHAVDKLLESQWKRTSDKQERKRCEEMGVWFLAGFCAALRGEEMLLIELAGTANSLVFLNDETTPHFCLKILGRTKGNQLSGANFDLPCVATTAGTNLRPGRWMKRLVKTIHVEGRYTGRLFQRKLLPSRLFEFEDDFYTLLERVQASTNLIQEELDLRDEAGISRTIRRGATDHAVNMGVDDNLIKTMNRWRSETRSKDSGVGRTMIDRYTTLTSLKPTFLRYSNLF
ncbi:hypothetical protein IV203_023901 [Nitzschia inconspicua]|uniref:Uncharacterized protein n=1 Tax=Nitzschia inconspicua TaxID=303405 RepID=A0A9K3KB88_9STRA|nr:hypothetical protein IV203_023901 [Nitzschia inconspicua]